MELLTCQDISRIAGVKVRTVYMWIFRTKQGQMDFPLPDVDIPRRPLWKLETVITWLGQRGNNVTSKGSTSTTDKVMQ